jgi:hypothetical protein
MNLFKEPIDELDEDGEGNIDMTKERFIDIPWNEVYDVLEFMVQNSARVGYARQQTQTI